MIHVNVVVTYGSVAYHSARLSKSGTFQRGDESSANPSLFSFDSKMLVSVSDSTVSQINRYT